MQYFLRVYMYVYKKQSYAPNLTWQIVVLLFMYTIFIQVNKHKTMLLYNYNDFYYYMYHLL